MSRNIEFKEEMENRPKINTRSNSRMIAVQALYNAELSGDNTQNVETLADDILNSFKQNEDDRGAQKAAKNLDKKFYRDLVAGVLKNKNELDELITGALAKDWGLGKVNPVVKTILRAGSFELKFIEKVPAGVVIKEYMRLSEKFAGEKELKFVNAVLDNIGKKLRAS